MSSDSSKNKGKRSRSSSEANNSFVKNVTSRVSGLLPTTITKWFSSPSSSNANGSAPTADSTDSSTEDETPDNVITHSAAKRMRFNSPTGKINHSENVKKLIDEYLNDSETTSNDTPKLSNPYSTVQSPPGRNTFRRETNFVSTPINSSNKEIKIERNERDGSMFKSQPSIAATGQSISSKRKSIFDTTSKEASTRATVKSPDKAVKAPYFKPTLLGSPFYPGRTTYGGAATSYMNEPNIKQTKVTYVKEANSSINSTMSNSTKRIMDLLEEYSSPLAEAKRIQQYIDNSSNSSMLPYTSKAASYKTRELLVPSVASIFRLRQKSRLMDTTNAARQIIASHSSASTKKQSDQNPESEYVSLKAVNKMKTHITRTNRGGDLEEPSIPLNLPNALLTIDQNNLPKFSFASTSTPVPISKNTFSKPQLSEKTATITKSTAALKAETASSDESFRFTSPVRISSDSEAINCTTSQHFTFGSPDKSIDKVDGKNVNDSTSSAGVSAKSDKLISSSKDWQCNDCWVNNKSNSDKCICCGGKKPVMHVMSDKCSVCKLNHSQPTIGKCISCEGSETRDGKKLSTVNSTDVSKWKCGDCWVDNIVSDSKCICCGAKKPDKSCAETPKLATEATEKDWKCKECWVNNLMSNKKCICCGAKHDQISYGDTPELVTKATVKDWKCEGCWVSNLKSDPKCICCGANNPKKSCTKPATKAIEKEWKCKDCWVYNHSSLAECMDCGGAKHRPEGSSSTVVSNNKIELNTSFKPVDKSFNNIVKAQSDMWECSSCLVRNESNKSKCVCCETDRDSEKKSSESNYNFNFGVNSNNTFKFGIDSKAKQESSTTNQIDPKSNQESQPKIEESETNNNVLEKSPSFKFTSPVKNNTDPVDTTKGTATNTPLKMNFMFGMPKQLPNNKSDSTINANDQNEKPQELPKIDFAKDNLKPLGNIFNPPLASKESTTSTPVVSASDNNETKETASEPLSQPSVAITTVTPSESTFSFATGGLKVRQNLFMTPASTTAVPSVSFMVSQQNSPIKSVVASSTPVKSLFQKPETATTSALSVFQSSPNITSSVSLFQKSDTSTTAVLPPATTAPMFSFGNNLSGTTPVTAEKPKFNFSFGSTNKTETSSMFKPVTFGSDNAETPNKFTVTSGNGIGTSKPVSGNTLGGTVGLPSGNSLISSGLMGRSKALSTGSPLSGRHEIPTDTSSGSGLQTSSALPNTAPGLIFGGSIQKENLWSSNNNTSTNLFASNSTTAPSGLQKPSAFTFGSSAPFNTNNTPTPAYGGNTQAAPVVFGVSNQNNNSVSLFSTAVRNQTAPSNIFGSAQSPSNAVPTMGMFGTPNVGSAPSFGSHNQSIPSFEAPSLTPAPAPAFGFGSPQASPFGFGQPQQQGQQQQQQQQQSGPQAGVYSFGGAPVGSPHVQFNMGSAPNTTMRRVRKAVRRNPPR